MTVQDLKSIFYKELNAIYGKVEVESLFFLALEHICDVSRIQLQLEPQLAITKTETDIFFKTLEDLKQQKPIQYIFGEAEFFGLKFNVNAHVLIPRQETEELVAWIIECSKNHKRPLNILDIGTGSGCIAISLAKHILNAEVYALDISKDALTIAEKNAEINNVNIKFIEANILDKSHRHLFFPDIAFDIIVSNPPYVRYLEKIEIQPNVLDNEPHLALFVEDENPLIFYKEITKFAEQRIKINGKLYFEINQYLGDETKALLLNGNWSSAQLKKDLNGNQRMLKAVKI